MLQEVVAEDLRSLFDISSGPQLQPQIDVGKRLFDCPPEGFGIVRRKLVGNDHLVCKSGHLELENFKQTRIFDPAYDPGKQVALGKKGQSKRRNGLILIAFRGTVFSANSSAPIDL